MERIDLCRGWTFSQPERLQREFVRLPHDFSIGSARTPDSPMGAGGGWFQGGTGVEESWTFPGQKGQEVRVEVYSSADEVGAVAERLTAGPLSRG